MMRPLVSVIMPAYNADKYIAHAIESIIQQTYTNWELIIVEDGSTDSTLDVIKIFSDERIRLLCNHCNRGIAYSTNRGIDCAEGKYIALLDDDDMAMPKRLEFQVSYMEKHNEIDILGGRSIDIDAEGKIVRKGNQARKNPKYIKAMLLFRFVDFYNGTVMFRRDFIEKNNLRYREGCYGMQDLKFYMESSKVGNISSIDEFLLKYRTHSNNETIRRMKLYSQERAKVYARFQDESLAASGFALDEKSLELIHKVLAEVDGKCESVKELVQLYNIFKNIIQQGNAMKIDYQDELEIVLKDLIARQIKKMDIFNLEISGILI